MRFTLTTHVHTSSHTASKLKVSWSHLWCLHTCNPRLKVRWLHLWCICTCSTRLKVRWSHLWSLCTQSPNWRSDDLTFDAFIHAAPRLGLVRWSHLWFFIYIMQPLDWRSDHLTFDVFMQNPHRLQVGQHLKQLAKVVDGRPMTQTPVHGQLLLDQSSQAAPWCWRQSRWTTIQMNGIKWRVGKMMTSIFYIKSVFFLALCDVWISMFICFDTLRTRAGKIRLMGTNRKTPDKYFEKPKERRSKTQTDFHLHMHVKQKHITRAWLTINKLSKHVYFFSMTDCAIETDNVGMVELTPDIQLLVLIVQDVDLLRHNTYSDLSTCISQYPINTQRTLTCQHTSNSNLLTHISQ